MARAPIQQQSSVAPAAAQATSVDTFTRFSPDQNAGRNAAQLSQALGLAGDYKSQVQIEEEQRLLEQSVAAGIARDTDAIRNLQMEYADSATIQTGLRIGEARAKGVDFQLFMDEARNTSPPPIDSDEYREWFDERYADFVESQEEFDPASLDDVTAREWARSVHRVRESDLQSQRGWVNRRTREMHEEQANSEFTGVFLQAQSGEIAGEQVHQNLLGLMDYYEDHIGLEAARGLALQTAINIANQSGDPSVLESMPHVPFMTPDLNRVRLATIDSLKAERSRARTEEDFLRIDAYETSLMDAQDTASIAQWMSRVQGDTSLRNEDRLSLRRRGRSQVEQIRNRARAASEDAVNQVNRARAMSAALVALDSGSGHMLGDIPWSTHDGTERSINRNEAIQEGLETLTARRLQGTGRENDPLAYFSTLGNLASENSTTSGRLRNYLGGISSNANLQALAQGNASDDLLQRLSVFAELPPTVARDHLEGEDEAFYNQFRLAYENGNVSTGDRGSVRDAAVSAAMALQADDVPMTRQTTRELGNVLNGTGLGNTNNVTHLQSEASARMLQLMRSGGMSASDARRQVRLEFRDNWVKVDGYAIRRPRGFDANTTRAAVRAGVDAFKDANGYEGDVEVRFIPEANHFVFLDEDGFPITQDSDGGPLNFIASPDEMLTAVRNRAESEGMSFEEGLRRLNARRDRFMSLADRGIQPWDAAATSLPPPARPRVDEEPVFQRWDAAASQP